MMSVSVVEERDTKGCTPMNHSLIGGDQSGDISDFVCMCSLGYGAYWGEVVFLGQMDLRRPRLRW
jgi:hypothetical protein